MADALRSALIVAAITLVSGVVGLLCGEPLGYGIAWASRRDPGELKDVLIWCFITTPLVFAAAGFLLAVRMQSDRPWLKQLAAAIFLLVASCSLAMIVWSYLEAPRYS